VATNLNILPEAAARDPLDPAGETATALSLIERFARALHRAGLPAHRIEAALERLADRLGLTGAFFAMPTAVFASMTDAAGRTRVVLARAEPAEVNLEKLSALNDLIAGVVERRESPQAACERVDAIMDAPPRYSAGITVAAFALAAAAASRFFGGGWRELVACTAIGVATGLLAMLGRRAPSWSRLFEPLAAFAAGALAATAGAVLPPMSVTVAMCAGLIVLIPGLTLTIGINELATGHLSSGSARLASAILLFLKIGFGVAAGLGLGAAVLGPAPAAEPAALPAWTLFAALAAAPLGFVVLFQARPQDAAWIVAASAVAFAAARLTAQSAGAELGAFAGAFAVGLASNAHARYLRRPASITLVPGIMLLVPGSVGFQSLSSLLGGDIVSGMQTAFSMSLMGVGLVTGLLLANAVLPPRRTF